MSDLTEWREELAGMLGEHAWDTSDEQKIDGEWVWGLNCDCGEFVPGEETNTHLADALLASPAMARLLAEAERRGAVRALREAGRGEFLEGDFPLDRSAARGYLKNRANQIAHPTDDHAGEAK